MFYVPDDRIGTDYPDDQSMIVSVPPCISPPSVPNTIVFNYVPIRVTAYLMLVYLNRFYTFKLLFGGFKFRGFTLVNSNSSD